MLVIKKWRKFAVFTDFRFPILPRVFGGGFWGGDPAAHWRVLTYGRPGVPETEELGTSGYQPDIPGEKQENRVRKLRSETRVPIEARVKV